MELIYVALLLHKSGKDITEDSVKKVLEAAGSSVDDVKIKALIAALDGVNIEEAIKEAAVTPAAAPAAEGGEAKADNAVEEEKKAEEEEKKKEEAAAGLGSLFG